MELPKTEHIDAKHGLRKQLLVLTAVLVLGVWAIVSHLRSLQVDLVESTTIQSASQYSQMLTVFRTLYTSEVVQKLTSEGIQVTHDYHQQQGAIPLPATLTILLADRIGDKGKDLSAKLYSPYPFPSRESRSGLKDDFAKDAWEYFNSGSQDAYVKVEDFGEQVNVRYAVADRMRASCVSCHNSHPQTPKDNWRTGDVRGVLEVVMPIDQGLAKVDQIFIEVGSLSVLLLVLTFGSIALIIFRLQEQKNRIETMNEQLASEVTERKIAEEEATAAKEEAVAANQAKSIFLANITHEIRTPMNAILGYAQILLRDSELTQDQQNSVSIINKSGGHLLGLINDVLEISRIEAGEHTLKEESFDLVELLNDLSEMFHLKAKQKGLRWQVENDFPSPKLPVVGDAGKLRQILINLVGNAIKFTDDGFVQLSVTTVHDNEYQFEIMDSGSGISKEHQQSILEPFTQGANVHDKGGTGLGLAISVKYLKMMGSDLLLESELGEGTRIHFCLNLMLSDDEDLGIEINDRVVGLKAEYKVTVLVIDDIEINRQLLHRMLTDIGVEVVSAGGGTEALSLLESNDIDLILTDLFMPDMDGLALLKEIKQQSKWEGIPLIAISASSLQTEQQHYLDLGFNDYISKPFYFESVYQCLQTHLHVEFDYQKTSSGQPISSSEIKIDSQMKQDLLKYAELYQVSEIEGVIQSATNEHQDWVRIVQQFIADYDMEGLIRYVQELEVSDE